MDINEARQLLADSARARDAWLTATVPGLYATAVYLAGSLGRGDGDEWSDVDLIVVGGDPLLVDALLRLPVPHNGAAGYGYVGAMYAPGPLPLWVDWYFWPPDLPGPAGSRCIAGAGTIGPLGLAETLDAYGRGPVQRSDPDTFTLAMVPIAAKFIGRSDRDSAAAMAAMLEVQTDRLVDGLRIRLAATPADPQIRAIIGRILDVAEALGS